MSLRERGRERTPVSPSPSPEPEGGPVPGGGLAAVANNTAGQDAATGDNDAREATPPMELARRELESRLRVAIDDLMQLAVCAAEVNEGDENIVRHKLNETMESLQALQDAADLPDLAQLIPEEVMGIIDPGRNPDAHTRSFANRLNSDNQQMRGQAENLDLYRTRLRDKMAMAFPEMGSELESHDARIRQEDAGGAEASI